MKVWESASDCGDLAATGVNIKANSGTDLDDGPIPMKADAEQKDRAGLLLEEKTEKRQTREDAGRGGREDAGRGGR
jgi:hypothetical protein